MISIGDKQGVRGMMGQLAMSMRAKRFAIGACMGVMGIVVCLGVQRLLCFQKKPLRVVVALPSWAADELHKKIETACLSYNSSSLFLYQAYIREQFLCVESLDLTYTQDGALIVSIDLADPLLLLNNELLLLSNNQIIPSSWYQEWRYANIPFVSVRRRDSWLSQSEIKAVRGYEGLLLTNIFDLIWVDITDAFLVPHDTDEWMIRCNGYQVVQEEQIAQCKMVYENLNSKKKKNNVCHILDIRFDKQIVVYADKEGRLHGSRISS